MMLDEMRAFYESTTRPAADWTTGAAPWAGFAATRGEQLAAARPEEHDMLLAAIVEVRALVEDASILSDDGAKGRLAKLAGLVHGLASQLHKHEIPSYETEAFDAARDIDQAAMQILRAMDGDYGML
jgi:hypothetical protein